MTFELLYELVIIWAFNPRYEEAEVIRTGKEENNCANAVLKNIFI